MPRVLNTPEETRKYIEIAQDPDEFWERRLDALHNLTYSLPQETDLVFEAVLPILENSDYLLVRTDAARLIAKIKDERAITALLAAFDKLQNEKIKGSIISALGTIRDARFFDRFLSLLEDKTQPDAVRSSAAFSLGELRDPRGIEPLGDALKEKGKGLQRQAVIGLGKIGGNRAVELLIETLQDEDEYVRALAISSLGDLKDKRAIPALEWVRDHDEAVDSDYRKLSQWAGYTAAKIKGAGLTTLEEYISTFREGDSYTRCRIADLLGERANSDAVDFLITALNDPEPEVRDRVIKALGDIRDERAIPALEQVVQNDFVLIDKTFSLSEIANNNIEYIRSKQNE
jgi:HEAT repeat protein